MDTLPASRLPTRLNSSLFEMEASSFDVDAFAFVGIDPAGPLKTKTVLVPGVFLKHSDVSSTVVLKQQDRHRDSAKNISVLSTITVDLNDFKLLDRNKPPEQILAHAVARYDFDPRRVSAEVSSIAIKNKLMDFIAGDQFFLMESLHGQQKPDQGKYDDVVKVVNLRNGEIGLVPATSLNFYPHAKVVEEFEWTAVIDGRKLLNRTGDLVSIGHGVREMSWDPDGPKALNDRFAFGRNRTTSYWGFIRIRKIVELNPDELESWRRTNLLPAHPQNRCLISPSLLPNAPHTLEPRSLPYSAAPARGIRAPPPPPTPPPLPLECVHCGPETCNCRENIDLVAEFKRNNQIPDSGLTGAPLWWQRGGRYHVGAVRECPGAREGRFEAESRIEDQGFYEGSSNIAGEGNGNFFDPPMMFYGY